MKTEDIMNKKVKVLDKGFVELCQVMGNDEGIVRCARQSYDKADVDLPEEKIKEQITFMLKNGHTSPFEQVVFQFRIRLPIFVARQLIRHRTARVNELSGRYTEFHEDDFHIPGDEAFINRYENDNVPVTDEAIEHYLKEPSNILSESIKSTNEFSFQSYEELIKTKRIPKELARLALPLTLYTELFWQMDLHNLLHFLRLRLDAHAQKEIREYAFALYTFVKLVCPITIEAFTEFQLNSLSIGHSDLKSVNSCLNNFPIEFEERRRIMTIMNNKLKEIGLFNKLLDSKVKLIINQLT
jgi:thymidylate synthase (FAD)